MWGLVSYLHSGDSHTHGSTTAIHEEEHHDEEGHADNGHIDEDDDHGHDEEKAVK